MRFRLLGLLEVEDEHGPLRIVPGRESALLALLLLRAPDVLPADRIVDELWGEAAPDNATKSVQVYVSRLRKTLGAERIETTPGGYRIRLEAGELDVAQFEALAGRGETDAALALWRGEPLADFRYAPFAQPEARRLEEIRDALIADRVDGRLAAGDGEGVIPELEATVAHRPHWERPRAQLMHALYLAGRQGDALALYRETRRLLSDELGIEPGPELQRLERSILTQDPALGAPTRRARRLEVSRGPLLVVVGALLAVAAAAAAAIVLAAGGGGGALKNVAGDSVVGIDAASGHVVEQVAVGNRPSRLATLGDSVWAIDAGDGTIARFDPRKPGAVDTFGTASLPTDLAATAGGLWVTSGGAGAAVRVSRFDPVRHVALTSAALPPAAPSPDQVRAPEQRYLVAGAASVWAIDGDHAVIQLDGRTGRVLRRTSAFASSLAFGDGRLWALDDARNDVERIDVRTGAVRETIHVPTLLSLGGIAVGGGAVWVTSPFEGLVWRVDPGPPAASQSIPLRYGAATIAYGGGSVWVGNSFDDSITRIDPRTNEASVVASVPAPQDLAASGTRLWVAAGSTTGRSGPLATSACGHVVYGGDGRPSVLVASDFDLEGGSSGLTRPMADTVEATLRAARFHAGRFSVGLQSCDDASRAAAGLDIGQCIANATAYALDRSIVGIVGLQSPCVHAELPILVRAPKGPVALVSPTSVDPSLTRAGPGPAAHAFDELHAGGVRSYVRTIAADHVQVAADAVLAHRLRVTRIGVVFNRLGLTSQEEYGWFRYAARRLPGLRLRVLPIIWNGPPTPLAPLVTRAHVDGAFLTGGVTQGPEQAVLAIEALRRALPHAPVIVTDWVAPWPALAAAGRAAVGVYATLGGVVRLRDLTRSQRDVVSSLPRRDRIPYLVGPTVQATDALLRAIAQSDGTRASVARLLVSEPIFDAGGDLVAAPVTVFRLDPGKRNSSRLEPFQGAKVESVIRPPRSLVIPPRVQSR